MKKLIPVFATLLLAGVFNDCRAQSDLPYNVRPSSDFKIGNPAYSKMVLELWKDWDDNTFDKHNYFADTVVLYLADSMVARGKAESLDGAKKYRGGMTSAKSIVHACIPVHNNITKEDAICIWGTETDTWPDGKVETRDLHEVWWFNKDGKVTVMRQWAAKFAQ